MAESRRSIRVVLEAEIGRYRQAMGTAAKVTRGVGEEAAKASQRTDSALSRMVASADRNAAAWTSLGGTLTAAGGAVLGLGAAAVATGVQYNTLRQTTTAALTSVLGTASKAADQMDRLDEFATNSPFSRQTFITAQQQLLAFGVEAQKVVPYLDAIQNAVAATGGSNVQIEELATIFAKVQGSAKITAEDLNEFGVRGVNAAELIGQQVGKTGAQIRDDITAGTLDAQVALDALSAGMLANFSGAADGVKDTFDGAVDRVKAAWRDLGAELAEPLVSAEGGGFLVDLANDTADLMRQFQAADPVVKAFGVGLTGTVAATAVAAGGFLVLLPRIQETIEAYSKVVPAGSAFDGVLRDLGKTAAIAGATLLAVEVAAAAIESTAPDATLALDDLDARLAIIARSGSDAAGVFEDLTSTWVNFSGFFTDQSVIQGAQSFQELLRQTADPGLIGGLQNQIAQFLGIFSSSDLGQFQARLEQVNTALADMANGGDLDKATAAFSGLVDAYALSDAQATQLLASMPAFREALVTQAEAADLATTDTNLLAIALGEVVPVATDAAGAIGQTTAANDTAAVAAERHAKAVEAYAQALMSAADPASTYEAILKRKEDAERESAEATAEATSSSKDSWEDYAEDVKVTISDLVKEWERQAEAARSFEANLGVIAAAGGQALADELRAKGPEVAGAVAETIAKASPAQQAAAISAYAGATGDQIVQEMASGVSAGGWRLQRAVDGTIRAVSPSSDIKVRVSPTWDPSQLDQVLRNMQVNAGSRRITVGTTAVTAQALGGRLQGFPTGGRLPGRPPSNPMADNLLGVDGAGVPRVLVRSREWVVNEPASDYYGDPIMAAINARQIPREALAGLTGLATGGAIASARNQLASQLRARRSQANAVHAARDADRARGTSATARTLSRAEERLNQIDTKITETRAKIDRLNEERNDLLRSARRGEFVGSVTGGLSGALGQIDDMFDLARSGDLTRGQSSSIANRARAAERSLTTLYNRADRLADRLEDARDRVQELASIRSSAQSAISGSFSLGDALNSATTNQFGETFTQPSSGRGLLAYAQTYQRKAESLARKLRSLQERGFAGAILAEVASQGVDAGNTMADALLQLDPRDTTALNTAIKSIDTWGTRAANVVTEGFYQGGISAAEGLVRGLESQQKAVEAQILKIAKGMEKALKNALGIRSPSRVFRALGHDTGEGMRLGLLDTVPGIDSAAKALLTVPKTVSATAYGSPQVSVTATVPDLVARLHPDDVRDIVAGVRQGMGNTLTAHDAAQDRAARYTGSY